VSGQLYAPALYCGMMQKQGYFSNGKREVVLAKSETDWFKTQ
jgi:hypothetical protein